MKNGMQRTMGAWIEAARTAGFLLLLVAGSAGLGFLIAWPLWLFATAQSRAYTIVALAITDGGIVFLAARAVIRGRSAIRDPGKPRRTLLSVMLSLIIAIVACSGAYMGALLFARGLWIFGVPAVLLWIGLLWLLGRGRRAAKNRKERTVPAENRGE